MSKMQFRIGSHKPSSTAQGRLELVSIRGRVDGYIGYPGGRRKELAGTWGTMPLMSDAKNHLFMNNTVLFNELPYNGMAHNNSSPQVRKSQRAANDGVASEYFSLYQKTTLAPDTEWDAYYYYSSTFGGNRGPLTPLAMSWLEATRRRYVRTSAPDDFYKAFKDDNGELVEPKTENQHCKTGVTVLFPEFRIENPGDPNAIIESSKINDKYCYGANESAAAWIYVLEGSVEIMANSINGDDVAGYRGVVNNQHSITSGQWVHVAHLSHNKIGRHNMLQISGTHGTRYLVVAPAVTHGLYPIRPWQHTSILPSKPTH